MPKNALCRKEFTNTELNIKVRTLENEDGSISINAEDTAIGFGWTQEKNGKTYAKWERMNGYISEIGFSPQVGKDDYIPESLFYMLGMKANNKTAQEFQRWLAMDVIPSIRKTGTYSTEQKPTSAMEELRLHYKALEEHSQEIQEVKAEVADLKDNMPLFNVECKEIQSLVKKKGTSVLGGYKSNAYNDNSLRGKVYSDIQKQLRREFGVEKYEAIKRSQFDIAKQIINEYKAPIVLIQEINALNAQTTLFDKKEE